VAEPFRWMRKRLKLNGAAGFRPRKMRNVVTPTQQKRKLQFRTTFLPIVVGRSNVSSDHQRQVDPEPIQCYSRQDLFTKGKEAIAAGAVQPLALAKPDDDITPVAPSQRDVFAHGATAAVQGSRCEPARETACLALVSRCRVYYTQRKPSCRSV